MSFPQFSMDCVGTLSKRKNSRWQSTPLGAPILVGQASPLRVATGGDASWGSKAVAAARWPTRINGASSFPVSLSPEAV